MNVAEIATALDRRRANRHLLLLLDFDGTLCVFHSDPATAELDLDMANALRAISRIPALTLGVVSGRRLADLRGRIPDVGDVYLAGAHGLEIEGPGASFIHEGVAGSRDLSQQLADTLHGQRWPGVELENKGISVAMHWRNATAEVGGRAEAAFRGAVAPFVQKGQLTLLPGACVLEAVPALHWNKGQALHWIRARVARSKGEPFTVYIGDDITDEDAFGALGASGMAIAASERPRGAEFQVDGPREVLQLLKAIT